MNKCKITNKSGVSQLIIKGQKGQQIIENEVYTIKNNKAKGLLHLDVVPKGASFKLVYNITGFHTLKEFLRTPLNKERFAKILQNILENLQAMDRVNFSQQKLLLNFNQVMVNPSTGSVSFVYVPIQFYEGGGNVKEFLRDIIENCMFESGEDTSYVTEYITILNRGVNFSVFDLEEFVDRLLGRESVKTDRIECSNCHAVLEKGTNFCPSCGKPLSGSAEGASNVIYDPLDKDEPGPIPVNGRKGQKYIPPTTRLLDNTGGTTVLGTGDFEASVYLYLVREQNGAKVKVNKPKFRIGTDEQCCDYCISDNKYVSRSHADILARDGKYYVIDLDSLNGTYVDDRIISAGEEKELFNGARLRFADENFTFRVE